MVINGPLSVLDWSIVSAFIFDNDGVIVNSEPLSCGALRQLFLSDYGVDIGDDFSPVLGTSDSFAISFYLGRHDLQSNDIEGMIERKLELYFGMAEKRLSPFPGFHDLMLELSQRYDLAVASSGSHEKIKFSLDQVDGSRYFPIICSATEVQHGKPAPDLFHYTAECLGVLPTACVVVEDSVKGIQGAKAAGMQVIGFCSSFSGQKLKDAGADLIVGSFDEIIDELP